MAKIACLLLMSLLLLACSPDDAGKLPPERPFGSISGLAVAGPIANAQVTVYGFGNGSPGARLGGTTTDDNGAYAIDIQAPSQIVLIEVRGGRYMEEANGSPVSLAEGQVLRAVGRYRSGQPLTLMVTPLTHMAVALAEYKIGNGISAGQAIDEASAAIDQFFALDVQATRPATITPPDASGADPSAGLPADTLYGLYLAGLSHWALWFSQGDITQWNSLTLSQALYHDLRSDGLLDGRGFNSDATALVPLGFGAEALDADAYRLAFSLHMLAFSQSPRNGSGFAAEDLLDTAHAMAAQTALVPEDATAAPLDGQAPILTLRQRKRVGEEDVLLDLEQLAGTPQNGAFILQVDIGGLLGARQLTTTLFDTSGTAIEEPRNNALPGSGEVLVIIDTNDYTDGEYTITLTAEDVLGKTTTESFTIKFDNTGPLVAVTSPLSTNQPTITLSGTFSDNISGVAGISVAGQAATLFTDDTWRVEGIAIEPGGNTLPISIVDRLGNRRDDFEAVVYRDELAPIIDSAGQHGQARLSNGDGSFTTARLQDINDTTPLYFETDRLELGTTLLNRNALDADGIAYFAFRVSDLAATDMPTAADEIQVSMQYRRNDQILSPWHPLMPVGGEYLIPLTSETLATDWHRASPLDRHVIDIAVTDPAGNQSTTRFSFFADFYVPGFDIGNDNGDPSNYIDDLGADIFANTAFADRASLNDRTIATTGYTFRNTTGKAFYLSLNDDSLHTTTQTVDKLVRENRVRLKTTTEWRIGLMTPTDNCPDFDPNNDSWAYPTSVWNWNGSDWIMEQVPASSDGAEEQIFEDALPSDPEPSAWTDVPDFDQAFKVTTIDNSPVSILTYGYDYILSKSITPQSGYLYTWTYTDLDANQVATCPEKRYFQQRETYTYELVPGYPKGVLTTETITDTPTFITTAYTLRDRDTGALITPVSGWYLIPAGHTVTIEKQVTTPVLALHDENIDDPATATYTPRRKDKTLTWSVARHLGMTLVHDAGEANIALMPRRDMAVGSGTSTYRISRP